MHHDALQHRADSSEVGGQSSSDPISTELSLKSIWFYHLDCIVI